MNSRGVIVCVCVTLLYLCVCMCASDAAVSRVPGVTLFFFFLHFCWEEGWGDRMSE